jgi:hypothetical protein
VRVEETEIESGRSNNFFQNFSTLVRKNQEISMCVSDVTLFRQISINYYYLHRYLTPPGPSIRRTPTGAASASSSDPA